MEEFIENEQKEEENPFIPAPKGTLYGEFDENHRLILKNQVEAFEDGLPAVEVETGFDGRLYEKGYAPEKPAPTKEQQKLSRKTAYITFVDPITMHITRLRDEDPVDYQKVSELVVQRRKLVADIKERYPYPDEE